MGMETPPYDSPPSLTLTDIDSAIGGSSASPDATINHQTNSDCDEQIDENPSNEVCLHRRNSWMRTSLRRSPSNSQFEHTTQRRWGSFRHSNKRLGSNALASQLYRSASFNSSGRSSNCDGDDMYSDVSLEDDMLDLNHKVQLLQQQVTALADTQTSSDDRYSRAKQENAALTERVHMLEEQLRDLEHRYEERLSEEQKRHRDMVGRLEREKQLELENYNIRLQTIEKECSHLEEECSRLRSQLSQCRDERSELSEHVTEAEGTVQSLREEQHHLQDLNRREREIVEREYNASLQLISQLSQEVEMLRNGLNKKDQLSPSVSTNNRIVEIEAEMKAIREENNVLKECNEELQAQVLNHGLEEGRHLLTGAGAQSIAAEFEAMTHDQTKSALKEQQEVNVHLRAYIDGILLNIVENYPQLLEVKRNSSDENKNNS